MKDSEDPPPSLIPTELDRNRILTMPVEGVVHSEATHPSGLPMFSVFRYPLHSRQAALQWKSNYLLFFMRGDTLCTVFESPTLGAMLRSLERAEFKKPQ